MGSLAAVCTRRTVSRCLVRDVVCPNCSCSKLGARMSLKDPDNIVNNIRRGFRFLLTKFRLKLLPSAQASTRYKTAQARHINNLH